MAPVRLWTLAIVMVLSGCGADPRARDLEALVILTLPEAASRPYVSVTRTPQTVDASWSFDLHQAWGSYCQRLRSRLEPTYAWKSQTATEIVFGRTLIGDAERVTLTHLDGTVHVVFVARDF